MRGLNKNIINRKLVASSLMWKMLERISSQSINFIVQVVIARILMPEDFGNLAILIAFTNFAAVFVQS
jgi:teichuronic acid exporter